MNLKPFWIVDSAPWIPDPILCQWNFDSGLQSSVGFQIPRAVFLFPKRGISDSTNKFSRIPDTDSSSRNSRDFGFPSWCDTGQLLFQVPPTLGEYGPSTAGEIARPKTAVVERARVKPAGMVDL